MQPPDSEQNSVDNSDHEAAERDVEAVGAGNVTVLRTDDKTIYLIGTAHVSMQSVEEVCKVIDEVKPDAVCIELCEARYKALTDENRWKNLDIFKVIKEGKTLFLLANLAIGAYQRRLGKELGVKPGAEMLAAAERAKALGASIELVDRDINVTLKRTWRSLSFRQKAGLLGAMMESLVSRQKIDASDIEKLKEDGELADMMHEFAKAMPQVQKPLIDERDRFMMSKIEAIEAKTVVAVVGAGHVSGMKGYLGKEIDREELNVIPPRAKWVGALKWLIPALILCAFAFGYYKNRGQTLEQMIFAWVLPNSIAAALLTAVAGGKLLSIATALIASPITSLNPLLGAGMVVGMLEAWLRKPTVLDAERINDDVQSLRGIYRNPFTRVLLVAVMATLGSAVGAWIGLSWVLALLA